MRFGECSKKSYQLGPFHHVFVFLLSLPPVVFVLFTMYFVCKNPNYDPGFFLTRSESVGSSCFIRVVCTSYTIQCSKKSYQFGPFHHVFVFFLSLPLDVTSLSIHAQLLLPPPPPVLFIFNRFIRNRF